MFIHSNLSLSDDTLFENVLLRKFTHNKWMNRGRTALQHIYDLLESSVTCHKESARLSLTFKVKPEDNQHA